jgi:hypothetical protein
MFGYARYPIHLLSLMLPLLSVIVTVKYVAYFLMFVVAHNFSFVKYLFRIVICQLLVLCYVYLPCPSYYYIFISIDIDITTVFYSIAF